MFNVPVEALERDVAMVVASDLGSSLARHIDLEAFERLLWLVGQHSPGSIQVARDGVHIPQAEVLGSDCIRLCSSLIRMGHSVALNHAERWDPNIARDLRSVGALFGCTASASVFLAPEGGAAFPAHVDAIDVIAVQLEGRKHWRIGTAETNLPTINATMPVDAQIEWGRTYELLPGNALYVPRGKIHEVRADSESYSLHISIGLGIRSHGDILRRAIDTATELSKPLRESDVASRYGGRRTLYGRGDLPIPTLNRYAFGISAQAQHACDLSAQSQLPGAVRIAISNPAMDARTRFVRSDECELSRERMQEGRIGIGFPGLSKGRINMSQPFLMFPYMALPALEAIRDSIGPFSPYDLPGALSDEGKLVIVKRLALEGLLQPLT
jgi:mannose-6-phosphate isomerase-like protein (cupin superfamily)